MHVHAGHTLCSTHGWHVRSGRWFAGSCSWEAKPLRSHQLLPWLSHVQPHPHNPSRTLIMNVECSLPGFSVMWTAAYTCAPLADTSVATAPLRHEPGGGLRMVQSGAAHSHARVQ